MIQPPISSHSQSMIGCYHIKELLDLQINSEDQRDIVGGRAQLQTGSKDKRGRKRKTKDGQSQSICGCGNVYSCSSALSLHIKNKHGGKVPQGSIGFPSANYRRREAHNKQTLSSIHSSQQTRQIAKNSVSKISQQQHSQTNSLINLSKQVNPYNESTFKSTIIGFNDQRNEDFVDNELLDNLDFQDTHQQTNHSQSTPEGTSKRRAKQNRQYVSKRIYLCGSCLKYFAFLQEAMLHIGQYHNGEIPDGSIFGLKREYLLNYFGINTPKINHNRKIYVFKCGCGKEYSCSSSLYYHIKTAHGGSEPQGTYTMGKPS